MPPISSGKKFKLSAVKLVLDSYKSVECIATDIGVMGNILFNWKSEYMANE